MEVPLRIIEGVTKKMFGCDHAFFKLTERTCRKKILITMHHYENFNNIEVLKFALWCRRNGYFITAYGMLNQLPMFGIFADEAILQVCPRWATSIYPNEKEGNNSTVYQGADLFGSFSSDEYDASLDLSRPPGGPETWPEYLARAESEISDEDVAVAFLCPEIVVRKEAYETYSSLCSEGFIRNNTVMCEAKINDGCGGDHLLGVFAEKTRNYELPVCTDLSYRRELCRRSGLDLMSVQILASLGSNWMWAAYGGASNILPFFPIKILSLSDAYCRPELTRTLFSRRYGPFGDVFPEFDTLLYCLPEEKDGPSRTDGHPPLPNLRKLVLEFSNYRMRFV